MVRLQSALVGLPEGKARATRGAWKEAAQCEREAGAGIQHPIRADWCQALAQGISLLAFRSDANRQTDGISLAIFADYEGLPRHDGDANLAGLVHDQNQISGLVDA